MTPTLVSQLSQLLASMSVRQLTKREQEDLLLILSEVRSVSISPMPAHIPCDGQAAISLTFRTSRERGDCARPSTLDPDGNSLSLT